MSSPQRIVIGHSVEGRPIEAWASESAPIHTLIIGGFHGDEPATIRLVEEFEVDDPGVALLPVLNPDGAVLCSRYNARGVDLNRNFGFNWHIESVEPAGAGPWSEPESRALRDFVVARAPAKIVSLHWALGEIDADGEQSTQLAEAMWAALHEEERRPYRLRVTVLGRGQRRLAKIYVECPGSMGQWAGYQLLYPDNSRPAMITLELPYNGAESRTDPLPHDHFASVCERWKRDAEGYLREVRPSVVKMLNAACAFLVSQRPA